MTVVHEPALNGCKRCSKCGEVKSVITFAVAKREVDGLQSRCRECQRVYDRARRKVKQHKLLHKPHRYKLL